MNLPDGPEFWIVGTIWVLTMWLAWRVIDYGSEVR